MIGVGCPARGEALSREKRAGKPGLNPRMSSSRFEKALNCNYLVGPIRQMPA